MTVAFATLFLGLVVGVQPVEVVVGGQVARVELLLDGERVGERAEPPWVVPVDFGEALSPHELVAVGWDSEGTEVGRVRQWINLPRSEAEAAVILEGAEDGRGAVARLAWESLAAEKPRAVTATFDGRPLEVTDPQAFRLPDHDPERLHFLRVELDFTANLSAVTEVAFGGAYRADTATELTAVPVLVEDRRGELSPRDLEGRLTVAGRPVTPVAVEEGPAEVVLVMDRAAQEGVRMIAERWEPPTFGAAESGGGRDRNVTGRRPRPEGSVSREARVARLRNALRLGEEQSVRFLWPFSRAAEHERVRFALFPRSEDHPPADGGMLWFLTAVQQPPFSLSEQRLADAVAVAGMSASTRGRRRAVVLVLSDDPADSSQLAPEAVRAYLSDLGVPLFVWSVGTPPDEVLSAWGGARPISREPALRQAVEELEESLARQRIVWIEGLHLPQTVALSGTVEGVRPVR